MLAFVCVCVCVCVCVRVMLQQNNQNNQIQSYVAYAFLNYAYFIIISFVEGHS